MVFRCGRGFDSLQLHDQANAATSIRKWFCVFTIHRQVNGSVYLQDWSPGITEPPAGGEVPPPAPFSYSDVNPGFFKHSDFLG